MYDDCVIRNEVLQPETIAVIKRADGLITPFLEQTDGDFIIDWNGVRTAALMASTPVPESPSQDKGKAPTSSSTRLKLLPPVLSPGSAHPSTDDGDDDDDDVDKLLEPVKRRAKIRAHDPIAPSSSQKSAGPGKKTTKGALVNHEPFNAAKHQHWLTSVSLSF